MRSGKPMCALPPSLRSVINIAFETIPILVGLMMVLSLPLKEDFRAFPRSTLLSHKWSIVLCPWLFASRWCLKLLNTLDLTRRTPLVTVVLSVSLHPRLFLLTPEFPGHESSKVDVEYWHSLHGVKDFTVPVLQQAPPVFLFIETNLFFLFSFFLLLLICSKECLILAGDAGVMFFLTKIQSRGKGFSCFCPSFYLCQFF